MKFDGFIGGVNYNKESKTWDIKKLGEPTNGAIIAGLVVSGKDKDGNKVYGSRIKVKFIIKSAEEGKRVVGLIESSKLLEFNGFFTPDNYTNKEGKTIQGVMIAVTDSTTVVEKQVEAKKEDAKKSIEVEEDLDLGW